MLTLRSSHDQPGDRGDGEAWMRVCRRLRADVGDDVFSSWFGRLELDALADDSAAVSVPTKFLKSWIQSHYAEKLLAAVAAEFPSVKRLAVTIRSSNRPAGAPAVAADPEEAAPRRAAPAAAPEPRAKPLAPEAEGDILSGSPLDPRLTFASFAAGRSNQLALAAAQRVAAATPEERLTYNPLYLHAAVGLGKTHLLQAAAHDAQAMGRRVVYLTAERFMYGFVAALKAQTAIAFKEKLRGIDILVIDDIQFLQGKSIQQEFCHTLNALIDAHRQIVIAADRPPSELESLDERVRSRLAGGLCVELGALDEPLRLRILEGRIAAARQIHPGFEVPNEVTAFVARAIQTNGRDLDGAVNRLLAHASLTGAPLEVATAELAIRDLVRAHEPKRVKIEDIQKLVATHFNVSRADILSSRRTANVVRPRQIAMYLSKTLTLRSLPEIGRRFGGRDHTTVLHAVRKIDGLAAKDATLNEELELLKRMLME
ncbi:chromosomal replication initiator protein DnaA [Methylocella sp.]|uniref:chromosomal replication initiator protein DnaA n=1 Tax=Methylocella sp. TaxID=1978226 RepID=UPI0037832946